jgi:hypothetical protein
MVENNDVGSNDLGVGQRESHGCVSSKRCCVHCDLTALFAKRDARAFAGGLCNCAAFTRYVTSFICIEVGEVGVNFGVSEW